VSEVEGSAERLQRELLRVIEAWHENGEDLTDGQFRDLALRVLTYQLRYNEPYARYCAARRVTLDRLPTSWEAIPPVPAAAFKEATLTTFDSARAALAFESSGTTSGTGSRHYMKTSALYDAALLAGFDRFVLSDGARLRYLNLVPNPAERPQSSLGYMMACVASQRGAGRTGWYLRNERLLLDALFEDLRESVADAMPVCLAATAFALLAVLDGAENRNFRFSLPPGSRVMETGGFKGRARIVSRDELYARASRCFGIDEDRIIAEYGMTELTSQWYDTLSTPRETPQSKVRLKTSPPWLRARAVAADGRMLSDGVVGALVHVDLANLFSCVAIETEDLGATYGRHTVLVGREEGAELRGCSLDAETLSLGR
jgi:hypothetical protein